MKRARAAILPGVAALLCTCLVPLAHAQVASVWREQQLDAMNEADATMQRADSLPDLLAQYQVLRRAYAMDGKPAFRAIFGQYLSWYQTFIGDYRDAELSFSIQQKALGDDRASPLDAPGWHAVPALDFIPRLARDYRVVFLNEAHNVALTRTLTVRLLKPLRAEGFNVFAVETLYGVDTPALNKRGYPTAASGFYTREPIYAEMVRTALKLGYKVVAYEADAHHLGNARESQQAENLWKILAEDPHAKLVVNAGYAHIQKTGQFLGADSMAEHFVKLSGIQPLSVEQTILIPHLDAAMNHPDYGRIIDALHPAEPIVFINRDAQPWSLRPGYDISVVFPDEAYEDGRPDWLRLGGARVPFSIDGNVCQARWPCMIAARYADEGDDAIPADRMVLDPVSLMKVGSIDILQGGYSTPTGNLYLRPGQRYRLTISDENGKTIARNTILVPLPRATPGSTGAPSTLTTGPACTRRTACGSPTP